jgi:transcriptional regulator GlxA family with amidase domain
VETMELVQPTSAASATTSATTSAPPRRLAVVAFNGASMGIMSFAFGVFDMAVQYGALPDLDVQLVSGEPGGVLAGGGLTCEIPYDLAAVREADLVIVPFWRDPGGPPPAPVLDALRDGHASGARVAGLCTGAFALAAAGLLDERPATTHWALTGLLAAVYPKVRVRPSVLYVDDGDVLTSGGGAAGMDLGLHIIRTSLGAAAANKLARHMVVPPHRPGGQAQYVEGPLPDPVAGEPVGEAMRWALDHLDQAVAVDPLARRARMSRRNFDRRFREITGTAPATWLTYQRVLHAQRLLESTAAPVGEIARLCGFPSPAGLRRHFRRHVGIAPSAYRASFSAAP